MTDPRQERLQLLALACTALSGSFREVLTLSGDGVVPMAIINLADRLEADLNARSGEQKSPDPQNTT